MGQKKLQRCYNQKLVGSYGGVAALRRVVPDRDVERWLSEQDTYTLHKPVGRRFKRRCVVVGGPNQQWQADLVDVSRLKKTNDGTTFLLTVIDVFSKRAWCIPLNNKSAVSLVAAFAPLLGKKAPITLQTDKGSEFLNRALQKLLKEYGVHHFATHNEETKAGIVERFNRTLKTQMWRYFTNIQSVRYIDVLQQHVSPRYWYGTIRGECDKPGRGLATPLRSRKWEYRSIELVIACASAKRSGSSRKVTWQTGPKSCLRSSTRTVRSHRFTAWRTGTANVWRGPSTNPNYRRLLCQKIRRTG